MEYLYLGLAICFIPVAFAVGFNIGADKAGELRRFNNGRGKFLRGVLK